MKPRVDRDTWVVHGALVAAGLAAARLNWLPRLVAVPQRPPLYTSLKTLHDLRWVALALIVWACVLVYDRYRSVFAALWRGLAVAALAFFVVHLVLELGDLTQVSSGRLAAQLAALPVFALAGWEARQRWRAAAPERPLWIEDWLLLAAVTLYVVPRAETIGSNLASALFHAVVGNYRLVQGLPRELVLAPLAIAVAQWLVVVRQPDVVDEPELERTRVAARARFWWALWAGSVLLLPVVGHGTALRPGGLLGQGVCLAAPPVGGLSALWALIAGQRDRQATWTNLLALGLFLGVLALSWHVIVSPGGLMPG